MIALFVLDFHVCQFHQCSLGPSISWPAISRPVISMVCHFQRNTSQSKAIDLVSGFFAPLPVRPLACLPLGWFDLPPALFTPWLIRPPLPLNIHVIHYWGLCLCFSLQKGNKQVTDRRRSTIILIARPYLSNGQLKTRITSPLSPGGGMSASRITDPTPIMLSVFEFNTLCVNVKLFLKWIFTGILRSRPNNRLTNA